MWKAYLKFDKYLLDKIQEGYLWLLDRTGVYVATLSFLVYAVTVAINVTAIQTINPWMWLAGLGIIGLTSGQRYVLQDKGRNEQINHAAIWMEGLRIRHAVDITFLIFLIGDLITLSPYRIVSMLGFITFQYLMLVKVRDRDKKPFFKPAEGKQELAMERGR